MLDQAIEALKQFDWGKDVKPLAPIDQAILESHGDAEARKKLEQQLLAALDGNASRASIDFICRKIRIIGTADSVEPISKLLSNKDSSHMARYALEAIPDAKAGKALSEALPQVDNLLKVGILASLGARQDAEAVAVIAEQVTSDDAAVATAAILALGSIQTADAAKALSAAKATDSTKGPLADALLSCAEGFVLAGKTTDALMIYKKLAKEEQPKHVRLAATRGMLSSAKN